jgi:Flp pilus assembly protein TadD
VYIPYINVLERLGQGEVARDLRQRHIGALEQQLELVPEDARARILLAGLYAWFRRENDAIRQLQRAIALRPNDSSTLYNAACVYGLLAKKEDALAALKKAGEAGYGNWDWVVRDPDLACLRDDPEFQRLMQEGQAKA